MSNINKQQLDETIGKLSSAINAGGKSATPQNRFILLALQELALILNTDPLPSSTCGEHCDHEVEVPTFTGEITGIPTPLFRAKLKVLQVIPEAHGTEVVVMEAVTDGTPEDNSFSKWTPAAELTMAITNPDLFGAISPLDKFYVDFTLAEKAAVVENTTSED